MREPRKRRRIMRKGDVGYGRPPVDQQFGQATRTGPVNKSGRPKKKKTPPTLDDALNKKVLGRGILEGKSFTGREAIYMRLVRLAVDGNLRAIKLVLDYDARLKEDDPGADPFDMDPSLMEQLLKKHDEETAERATRRPADGAEGPDDES